MSGPAFSAHELIAGRYRLQREIGRGAMGVVWAARDELLQRDVAVKQVLLPDGLSSGDAQAAAASALKEARAVAALSHPNVITLFDVLDHADGPVIVMEYLPSQSLWALVRERGRLPADQVATIGVAVGQALLAVHAAGVIHRDVKPGNVLIADDGRIKLTDFGIARNHYDPHQTGTLLRGTPAFMAPELISEGAPSPMSDAWALGSLLYSAATGELLFTRPTALATLAAVMSEPVPDLAATGMLQPVLAGLLTKNPHERMPVAQAVRMLESLVGSDRTALLRDRPAEQPTMLTAGPRPGSRSAPSAPGGWSPTMIEPRHEAIGSTGGRRWWPVIGIVAVAALVAGIVVLTLQNRAQPNRGEGAAQPAGPGSSVSANTPANRTSVRAETAASSAEASRPADVAETNSGSPSKTSGESTAPSAETTPTAEQTDAEANERVLKPAELSAPVTVANGLTMRVSSLGERTDEFGDPSKVGTLWAYRVSLANDSQQDVNPGDLSVTAISKGVPAPVESVRRTDTGDRIVRASVTATYDVVVLVSDPKDVSLVVRSSELGLLAWWQDGKPQQWKTAKVVAEPKFGQAVDLRGVLIQVDKPEKFRPSESAAGVRDEPGVVSVTVVNNSAEPFDTMWLTYEIRSEGELGERIFDAGGDIDLDTVDGLVMPGQSVRWRIPYSATKATKIEFTVTHDLGGDPIRWR